MKQLLLGISALAAFLLFLPVCHADSTTVNGYRIDVLVTNTGMGQLHALGRVDGGEPCKKLRVNITARNENNKAASISATVDDVGNGGDGLLMPPSVPMPKGISGKL
jgi:hypothetical protein